MSEIAQLRYFEQNLNPSFSRKNIKDPDMSCFFIDFPSGRGIKSFLVVCEFEALGSFSALGFTISKVHGLITFRN